MINVWLFAARAFVLFFWPSFPSVCMVNAVFSFLEPGGLRFYILFWHSDTQIAGVLSLVASPESKSKLQYLVVFLSVLNSQQLCINFSSMLWH